MSRPAEGVYGGVVSNRIEPGFLIGNGCGVVVDFGKFVIFEVHVEELGHLLEDVKGITDYLLVGDEDALAWILQRQPLAHEGE